MSEAFSLKQFGFKNAIGDPNQFDYTMQNVATFSQMETLPPMPNVYNQSYQNIAIPQPQPSPEQPTNTTSSSSSTAASLPPYMPSSMPMHPLLDNNNEGLFKNNPNNPFFGIPASMDWTEWNEWNQSNQGNTTWHPLA
jgi:hypothetical protein